MLGLRKEYFTSNKTTSLRRNLSIGCGKDRVEAVNQLPFDTEAELVRHIELNFFDQWKKPNVSFLRELDSSNGIADIVVFEMKKNSGNHLSLGEIPPRWAYALYHLPYRKIFTTDDLARTLGVSRERANIAVKKYMSLGFCTTGVKKNTWKKIKQPQLLTTKIYAIEAKLSKWNHALSQAIRYLDYANQSWVVLDTRKANAAINNIDKFIKFNIGLATIDTSGEFKVQYKPTSKKAKSEYRLWYANAEISRILNHLK